MELGLLDIAVFVAFFSIVIGVSMYKSRKEETSEDFFLAGRGLFWPLIGLSLIAANISTEHFVGMAGQGAGVAGMAVASYEWIAAIVLVFVAFFFLPRFLRAGIYTMPEYLEYRYNATARAIMAIITMFIYVLVTISMVIYTGGLALQTLFGDLENPRHLLYGILTISSIAALYTIWGGLKAVAWADLFQGSALIIGGAITMFLGFKAIGVREFFTHNADRLHMILHRKHPVLPWTALVVGLWIPNFYYWGLNQYITQRTLAAKTLRQGQVGVIFAAFLKLTIPFIIIFPGIMSLQLYGDKMVGKSGTDAAYPLLIRYLVGPGVRAFIFAAISGAVISSLASMLNSASTIFTMDIFKRHIKKDAGQKMLVWTGRISTLVFVLIGGRVAIALSGFPTGIFTYIQEFQGFISPGVLAAFVFGFIFKRAPGSAGVAALIVNPIIYGLLLVFFSTYEVFDKLGTTITQLAFLNRMAVSFGVVLAVMIILTIAKPLSEPKALPVREEFDMKPAPSVLWLGVLVIVVTLTLYVIFW
jgi:SSS family solute:Na+ symporter